MNAITHRTVETNGIRMHVAEQGTGPLVILCHGFPESWYSWRHQLAALAAAGFHAVAPDMRGYGQTDAPAEVEAYTLLHLVGAMVGPASALGAAVGGVVSALGETSGVIAGHDWGARVAWHAALLRPDRFRAVIGLSVPFRPRGAVRPTTVMPQTDDAVFYQLYFQTPGVAEAEFERDVRLTLRRLLYSASGDAPRGNASIVNPDSVGMVPRRGGLLSRSVEASTLPPWLTEADIEFFTGEFTRTGFRGGLNWYRNIDRNWELLAPFAGACVTVPALYIAGGRDLVVAFRGMDQLIPNLSKFVPHLQRTLMLPGCGHWTQQERPGESTTAVPD